VRKAVEVALDTETHVDFVLKPANLQEAVEVLADARMSTLGVRGATIRSRFRGAC
jgi:hypothetical protein